MKKKSIGIFISILFLLSCLSLSSSAKTIIDNEFDDEHIETDYDDPLDFRVEFEKLFDRIWIINGYAINTFDKQITVRWGTYSCGFGFFYMIPNEDIKLLVGSYHTNIYHLKFYNKWFEFEPGEEKLIDSKRFFGISNMIRRGFYEGHNQYIESWPILPNGEYEIRASLSPYQNKNYEMMSLGLQKTIIFHYS